MPVVVAIVLTLFAWPSARLEPRDLPIGVVGPAAMSEKLEADARRYGVNHASSSASGSGRTP